MGNRFSKRSLALAILVSAAAGLTGCGGGGSAGSSGGGAAASLEIASKVSVVDTAPSGGASVRALNFGAKAINPASLPTNSDYNKDETRVFVEERSAGAFDIVNEILCSLAQSRYGDMLNAGNYRAQIDMAQCSSGNDDASSAGQSSQNQSSGSSQPDYEYWTLNSSRADDSSPHIVKAWVHEEGHEDEPEKVIYAKLTITEAVSSSNPYGIFTLYFKAHPVVDGTADTSVTMMRGYLKSERDSNGKVLLKFIADGGFDANNDGTNDMSFSEKVTLDRSADGASGGGTTDVSDTGPWGSSSESYTFAFNNTHFLRRDSSSNETCLNRAAYDETAWRYGLYNSSGSRVTRNSGFPIKYTSGGKDYHGWIGYWGLWLPESVSIPNGATVYKMNYSSGQSSSTPYTVLRAGGKLKKHTRKALTLDEIKGVPLQMFDNTAGTEFRVEWTGSAFMKTGTMNRTTWLWEDLSPQQAVDLGALNMTELNMWSQSLGGNVQVKLDGCSWNNMTGKFSCSAASTTGVVIYLENLVYPTDTVPSTLACLDNCPDPAALTGTNPYFDTGSYHNQNVPPTDPSLQYKSYTFNPSTMTLSSSGSPVVLSSANASYQWGINTGPLFEPTSANLSQLACSWDANYTCAWQARSNLDTFYTWETGVNNWNRFTGLSSGGAFLSFQQPLSIKYARSAGGATSTYMLQYAGFGELQGIPGKCVDRDSGADANCGPDTRWIPQFTIPEGTTVLDGSDNATEYIVKPLEKEQRMQSVALSNCSGLTLTPYALPDLSGYVDPNIGPEPTVTDAPAVIGGVLQ